MKIRFLHITFLFIAFLAIQSFAQKAKVFDYTGSIQEYTVPEGVTSIKVELFGAQGGFGRWEKQSFENKYKGGKGGMLSANYPVTPGETIYIYVGGMGDDATDYLQGKGGFNGGADGRNTGNYGPYCGGGGGGASDIRIGGKSLENRVLVAGGGGGSGSNYPDGGDHGGNGGGLRANNGLSEGLPTHESVGQGASQTEGGEGGQWRSYLRGEKGKLGLGGTAADSTSGGGGGGGYFGGGGGSWSGGGGGSSFAAAKATEVKHNIGVQEGHGKVVITPACIAPEIEVLGGTEICHGEEITLTGKSSFGAEITWSNNIVNGEPFKPFLGDNTYTMKTDNPKECPVTIDIKVKPGKPVIIASKTAVCEGEEITLDVQDMNGIVWDNGVKQGVPFAPPVGENKYKVTREGECASEDEIMIRVNKVKIDGHVTQIEGVQKGEVDVLVGGGSAPYTYRWMNGNVEISIEKDLNNLAPGTYELTVTDNIGCSETASFTIEEPPAIIDELPPGPRLTAETSPDEAFVTVSYPGAFEYKIENMAGETVITGHSVDDDVVDITRLPKGRYRVSLIYKQIKQYTTFVKN